MTTGIALTIWTFVSKVMSLLFNTLSRFIIAFLPGSKRLLISWLQSPSAVTLEPKKIKSVTVFIAPPFICEEVMRPDARGGEWFWSPNYTQEGTLLWLLFYREEGAELKTPLPTQVPWEP